MRASVPNWGCEPPAQGRQIRVLFDAGTALFVHGHIDQLAVPPIEATDDVLARAWAAALGQVQLVVTQGNRPWNLNLAQNFPLEEAMEQLVHRNLARRDRRQQVFAAAQVFTPHRFEHRLFHLLRGQIETVVALQLLQPLFQDFGAVVRALPLTLEKPLDGLTRPRGVGCLEPNAVGPGARGSCSISTRSR